MMDLELNWDGCELVEKKAGEGRPVVKGTKILADAVLNSYDLGENAFEISEHFRGLPVGTVRRLIEFANSRRGQLK